MALAALACRAALKRRRQVATAAIDAFRDAWGPAAFLLGAGMLPQFSLFLRGGAPRTKRPREPALAGPVQGLSRERWAQLRFARKTRAQARQPQMPLHQALRLASICALP